MTLYSTPPRSRFLVVTRLLMWSVLCSIPFSALVAQPSQSSAALNRFEIPPTDEGLVGTGPIRRYDWFKKLWVQRRSEWAQSATADQQAIVFLGDSITQGWGDRVKQHFPGLKIANRGISGDTSRGVLIRLKSDVIALNPSAVVLLIGTNDLEEKAEPETIVSNISLILNELNNHNPHMQVVVCQVFPSSEFKKRPADKIRKLNQLLTQAVKTEAQVTLLETWPLFANAQGDAKQEEFPDLLHLNDVGYAKWATALKLVLATHQFVETEFDDFKPEPGFLSLFNGKDLTGWTVRDFKSQTIQSDLSGRFSSPDGRYLARSGRLVVATPPGLSRVQQLWTSQSFSNDFVLKLEFRATPNADSGVFIRHPQLQCRDYPLAGPFKDLKQYKFMDWNELVITVRGTNANATCNGELLTDSMSLPISGPIGLEGDRGQMEYRRIRIQTKL